MATSFLDVVRARDPKLALARISGHRSTHDTTDDDVWSAGELAGGPANITWPAAAAALSFVSTDAADAAAGTGARTLLAKGLDANYEEIEETVTMNGLTPVVTTKLFLRGNLYEVASAGSGQKNAGAISVTHGATIIGGILAGKSRSAQSHYTVPAGKNAYVMRDWAHANAADVTIRFLRRQGNDALAPAVVRHEVRGDDFQDLPRSPEKVGPKTDLWIRAQCASGAAAVSAGMDLLLETI